MLQSKSNNLYNNTVIQREKLKKKETNERNTTAWLEPQRGLTVTLTPPKLAQSLFRNRAPSAKETEVGVSVLAPTLRDRAGTGRYFLLTWK